MRNLNYLVNHILYQNLFYSVSYSIQYHFEYIIIKHGEKTDNPSIMIYIKKIENRITFNIKTGYYLKFLMPETIKLLGISKINS